MDRGLEAQFRRDEIFQDAAQLVSDFRRMNLGRSTSLPVDRFEDEPSTHHDSKQS